MSSIKKNSIQRLIKVSWEATKFERLRFFSFLFLYVLSVTADFALPFFLGYILGIFVEQGFTDATLNRAGWLLVLYTVVRLLSSTFSHFAKYLQNTVDYSARMYMMSKMFNSFLAFPLRWHLHRHSGENLAKLHRSVGAVHQVINTFAWQIVEGVIKIVYAGAFITILDPLVSLNVLLMCILTLVLMIFFNKRLVSFNRENFAFYDKLNRTVVDFFTNIVTVKTLRLEKSGEHYFGAHQPTGLNVSKRISKFQELKWGSLDLGYGLVLGSSLWIYFSSNRGLGTAVNITEFYVLTNYLDRIFQAVNSFTGYYGAILDSATAFEDGDKILSEVADLPVRSTKRRVPRAWNSLLLDDLAFSYGLELGSGIRGLSLEIRRGEKIALVGPSGGGKSTLLKIMGGMIAPERCKVSFDSDKNYEIEDVSHISLLIPQEPEVFTETVRYNLTFNEGFTEEQINFFVALCKVDGVINKLPGAWDNFLAEKGQNLSVGEKQRIALARGLVRANERDILLLDEPTSSLDPFTEKEIFNNLLTHFKDRTIITACHRLALVPLFDKVIYVKAGLIEEAGAFEELLQKNGSFAKSWQDYQNKVVKSNENLAV